MRGQKGAPRRARSLHPFEAFGYPLLPNTYFLLVLDAIPLALDNAADAT